MTQIREFYLFILTFHSILFQNGLLTNFMKPIFTILFFVFAQIAFGQNSDTQSIQKMLSNQTSAWNKGDLEAFMDGYWKNDSLAFIGKSGITYGYQQTLANYKKHYPDKSHMGQLKFDILSIKAIDASHYFIIGKWHLTRTVGDAGGHFTLLFKKIDGKWNIIADHSS